MSTGIEWSASLQKALVIGSGFEAQISLRKLVMKQRLQGQLSVVKKS